MSGILSRTSLSTHLKASGWALTPPLGLNATVAEAQPTSPSLLPYSEEQPGTSEMWDTICLVTISSLSSAPPASR